MGTPNDKLPGPGAALHCRVYVWPSGATGINFPFRTTPLCVWVCVCVCVCVWYGALAYKHSTGVPVEQGGGKSSRFQYEPHIRSTINQNRTFTLPAFFAFRHGFGGKCGCMLERLVRDWLGCCCLVYFLLLSFHSSCFV